MTVQRSTAADREAALRSSLATVREPRAGAPGPDPEALRRSYLDLLKLCLCDLAGTTTVSVGPTPDGAVVARELSGDQRRLRAVGLDWPMQGTTMSGLRRLDDLQECVDAVLCDGVEGDLIEAGAWRGGATILMRAALDSSRDGGDRTVWVADSFQGFPESAGEASDQVRFTRFLRAFDFLAVSLEEVQDNFARFGLERGVRFVPGFFKDTLPKLTDRRWAIVRLDGDTYEATQVALECLYPGLSPGGYLVIDDYGAFEECRRAVDEFREEQGITEPIEEVDWTCVRWRRGSDPSEKALADSPAVDGGEREPPEISPAPSPRVPSAREMELQLETNGLRERLTSAEGEIARVVAERDELRTRYEESLSWRITRPLRSSARIVRGISSRRSD
jgi:Macrocin-O-methyltransferase (TylF)